VILILLLAVALYFGYRVTTPEDRERLLQRAIATLRLTIVAIRKRHAELQPVRDRLRARTALPFVTPALAVLLVAIYFMASTDRSPAALLGWGASVGPLTTNGEWWRLLTSTFVHTGIVALFIHLMALLTAGLLLERYAGSMAILTVYVSGGVLAAIVTVWQRPVAVTGGATGAILGIYGLLLACGAWTAVQRWRAARAPQDAESESLLLHEGGVADPAVVDDVLEMPLPLAALQRLVVPSALFFLYCLLGGPDLTAQLVAIGAGLAGGLVMTRHVCQHKPTMREIGIAFGGAVVVAIAIAIPVRGIADVKPEMEKIAALEARTAGAYDAAYADLKRGKMTRQAVAQLIDHTIIPDLQAAHRRLEALVRVPAEHQPLVDDAVQYVELRTESWRLRADGLRKLGAIPDRDVRQATLTTDTAWRTRAESQYRANLVTFGKAEGAERASLEALRRITPITRR
jgi:membrane associated rhomboid family serine protease